MTPFLYTGQGGYRWIQLHRAFPGFKNVSAPVFKTSPCWFFRNDFIVAKVWGYLHTQIAGDRSGEDVFSGAWGHPLKDLFIAILVQ